MNFGFNQESELLNGRVAMVAVVVMAMVYAATGQLVPGLF